MNEPVLAVALIALFLAMRPLAWMVVLWLERRDRARERRKAQEKTDA